MTVIKNTLDERGGRYGSFEDLADISDNIQRAMEDSPNWSKLVPYQKEALKMIVHKIARILNGDPDYHDSWHDIAGYSTLVEEILLGIKR